ncbi:MAG: hypothetical protein A3I66_08780 [Burkholderiales bacterium RIFCSPLOWO2_02_FULL_57_36]|nr:MAG: hypothetical protein A3I66_08780 [Burkholderiales bacterium RIFCSPLOWO2_02_FULL_57_36]
MIKQKTRGRSGGFYSISAILYGVGFLSIAIAIAVAMKFLEAEKLHSSFASSQLFSQHLISFANLLLISSAVLYACHLWITARAVGQLASGMATMGAMGVTVALLIRWLGTNSVHPTGHIPFSNLYDVTALFSAATVVIYLAMEKVYRTRAAGAFVMPIVVAAILLESLLLSDDSAGPGHLAPALKSYWVHAHILSNIIGYGAFAIAASLGIMYWFKEWKERGFKTHSFAIRSFPDLERIDRLMCETITLGFLAYTVGTILGVGWSYDKSGEFWSWTRTEISALIVWSVYLAYFYGRYMYRWRGKWTASLALIGFGVSVFCFAGMNLFLNGRHA